MSAHSPKASLRAELDKITELLALLQQEQDDLVQADIDHLTTLTPHKAALVNDMASLAAERHRALAAAGFHAEEAGMAAWLAAQHDADADALWQAVLEHTRSAKELNRLNGLLINKHLSTTQGALQALRPQSAGGAFYGPSGHTTTSNNKRGIIAG